MRFAALVTFLVLLGAGPLAAHGSRIIVRFADSPVRAQNFANLMRRLAAEARVSAGAWQASVDISLTGSARALSDFVTLTGACARR